MGPRRGLQPRENVDCQRVVRRECRGEDGRQSDDREAGDANQRRRVDKRGPTSFAFGAYWGTAIASLICSTESASKGRALGVEACNCVKGIGVSAFQRRHFLCAPLGRFPAASSEDAA